MSCRKIATHSVLGVVCDLLRARATIEKNSVVLKSISHVWVGGADRTQKFLRWAKNRRETRSMLLRESQSLFSKCSIQSSGRTWTSKSICLSRSSDLKSLVPKDKPMRYGALQSGASQGSTQVAYQDSSCGAFQGSTQGASQDRNWKFLQWVKNRRWALEVLPNVTERDQWFSKVRLSGLYLIEVIFCRKSWYTPY